MCAVGGERKLGVLAITDDCLHQQHRAKPSLHQKLFFHILLFVNDVELFVVHDVRPRFACADAVQLEPQ